MYKIEITRLEEKEVKRTFQENTVDVKLIEDLLVYTQVVDKLDLIRVINAVNLVCDDKETLMANIHRYLTQDQIDTEKLKKRS